MNDDNISEWAQRAKANEGSTSTGDAAKPSVKVIRKEPTHNRGALIMAVAEALRPHLTKLFEGSRDDDDMLTQPAHVRAFALNMAQRMVHAKEQDNAAA